MEEGAVFCPSCGARMDQGRRAPEYVKPRERGWTWIILVVIGGIVILASAGMVIGGTGILWAERNLSDEEGFLTSGTFRVHSGKHAIILKGGEIDIEFDLPRGISIPGNLATVKTSGESNTDRPVFIGIAEAQDAISYLSGKNYDEVVEFDWSWSHVHRTTPVISYKPHVGLPPDAPEVVSWVASVSGPGKQTLKWDLEEGSYWVVVMNADASSNVDVDLEVGINSPFLGGLARVFVVGGVLGLLLGGGMIYVWGFRRR